MRRTVAIAWLLAGCEAGPYRHEATGDGGPDPTDAGVIANDLRVDTDRDGRLTRADDVGEETWEAEGGAIFLANVDDDDDDGIADAVDAIVNGEADARDLAHVEITAWPSAPEGTTGTLSLVTVAPSRVRFFRQAGATWTALAALPALTTADLQGGVTLGVEGTALLSDSLWDGRIEIGLAVTDAAGAALLEETVEMRQASMVIAWNSAPTTIVHVSDLGWNADNQILRDAVQQATDDVGILHWFINSGDDDYVYVDPDGFRIADQWTQDFFEMGATYMPGDGVWQRLGVGIRLKPPQNSGYFVEKEIFGIDNGHVYPFSDPYDGWRDGASLDYGGNLEVVPPHEGYPAGRILAGTHGNRLLDPVLEAFLQAQYAQAPILEADTNWLVVGHIDEAVGFVEDPLSERGWKATLTAPREAWAMLEGLVEDDPDNADLVLFNGLYFWTDTGFPSAEITVGEILEDVDLAAANEEAQGHADDIKALLMTEAGLVEGDFVYLPFLWEPYGSGPSGELRQVAYIPGTVNLLTFNGVAMLPEPFGPRVGGEDVFERVTRDRLEALGLDVRFVDNWNLYHRLLGEVHCGTQTDRTIPRETAWWDSAR